MNSWKTTAFPNFSLIVIWKISPQLPMFLSFLTVLHCTAILLPLTCLIPASALLIIITETIALSLFSVNFLHMRCGVISLFVTLQEVSFLLFCFLFCVFCFFVFVFACFTFYFFPLGRFFSLYVLSLPYLCLLMTFFLK